MDTSATDPLAPVTITVSRRKRRLVVDTCKVIPNAEFKQQLQDTSDIVGKPDLAPASKKAMYYLTYGGVGKFFAYPGRRIPSNRLAKLFFSHLTMTTEVKNGPDDPKVLPPLDPELRTPEYSPDSVSVQTGLYHLFGDPVAKRNANSFDYLIKGMHIRPNLIKTKERRRPIEHVLPTHNQIITTNRTHLHHHSATTSENLPVYEIVNIKSEEDLSALSSVVLTPVENMSDETMLVGLDCNFDSTNNKDNEDDVVDHGIPDEESHLQSLQGLKQEAGNLVYTIQADQSVVIKSENDGMDDNVLYFITL